MVGAGRTTPPWLPALARVALTRIGPVRIGLAGAALALLVGTAAAQEAAQQTPVPTPPKGNAQSCVAPTDWMRRYHMTVLGHQRDKTVHDGVRAGPFDLKGCVSCHAVKGADGVAVTIADPKHFCRGCHDYAAVAVDCFECHASRPLDGAGAAKAAAAPTGIGHEDHGRDHGRTADIAALARYLERIER